MKIGKKGGILKKILTALCIIVLAVLTALAIGIVYIRATFDSTVDLSMFENVGSDTVTKLYYTDADGNAVEIESERLYGSQVTVYTPIDEMPKNLINAFVAIEDKRFFEHEGVDWYRTAGAVANYLFHFRGNFGASTITQQLVKNVTGQSQVEIGRKIQEIFYAIDVENRFDKAEILEMYLNIVNLSDGCYGVGAAAERYFSKPVGELTLLECATLAGITKNPSYYNPRNNAANNRERRDLILSEMLSQGYISEKEYNENVGKEPTLNIGRKTSNVNSWYTDMVINDVINDLVETLGYSSAAASYLVYNGGLKIYTAMNPDVQKIVEEYYADTTNFPYDDLDEGRSGIIIISPDGDILAVAGAIGEKTANRVQNYATTAKRPSGSVIKPLAVYAPALEEGIITWSSVYDDTPVEFYENRTWPNNADMTYRGLTDVSVALRDSLNTVSVKVLYDLGTEKSYEYLTEKFHIESLVEADKGIAALALGQQNYGVTLREVTGAYTVFVNEGVYSSPRSYYAVMTESGDVLLDNSRMGEQVISSGNAAVMTKLLTKVVTDGSISGVITLQNHVECAGKTGTTQNTCDRWFVGYTPYCICGVWYGHEYPSTLPESAKNVSTGVWNDVMTAIYRETDAYVETTDFKTPENIVRRQYCRDSGKLLGANCAYDPRGDRAEYGWFVRGTEPLSFCECHKLVEYDLSSGGVANSACPKLFLQRVALIDVERSFPEELFIVDAQYVYRDVPEDVPLCTAENLPYFFHTLDDGDYCGVSETEKQFNRGCAVHR